MPKQEGRKYEIVIIGADKVTGKLPPEMQKMINREYTRLVANHIRAHVEANYPKHERQAVYAEILSAL